MILQSPTESEIALTLAFSHQNERGNFPMHGASDVNLAGLRQRKW